MEAVYVAVITGLLSLVGIILTNMSSNRKIEHKLETAQEVTNTKLEHLTNEVRRHNSFAERLPIVETEVKDISKRVDRLENK